MPAYRLEYAPGFRELVASLSDEARAALADQFGPLLQAPWGLGTPLRGAPPNYFVLVWGHGLGLLVYEIVGERVVLHDLSWIGA